MGKIEEDARLSIGITEPCQRKPMPGNQESFFYSQLECPVCGTINEYTNVRTGSYTISGRDTDFKPVGRQWVDPACQKYDPLLFLMATCKRCFYTREFNNEFRNWDKDTSFKTNRLRIIRDKHLAEFTKVNGVLRLLGSNIDTETYPLETAIIKFLMGILDVKASGNPTDLDQGRYYLRISWLFRDYDGRPAAAAAQVVKFIGKLRGIASAALGDLDGLAEYITNLKEAVDSDLLRAIESLEVRDETRSEIAEAASQFALASDALRTTGARLAEALEDAALRLKASYISADPRFHQHASFQQFLAEVRQRWDDVPFSAREAQSKAREYYMKAYQNGEIGPGFQQIQATYLIAELSRRIGNHESAERYFGLMTGMAQELIANRQSDATTVKFATRLLEMATEQARMNTEQTEGALT